MLCNLANHKNLKISRVLSFAGKKVKRGNLNRQCQHTKYQESIGKFLTF